MTAKSQEKNDVPTLCNQNTFRHLDLFSGIGGFSIAASTIWGKAHEIVAFCEKDTFCQKRLRKAWPQVPIVSDVAELKGVKFERLDLITGGFPCQPFSTAGKQKGKTDDRYLWPEMFRIIKKNRPRWIIGENVIGIIPLALDEVLSDLENIGYEAWPVVIPACAVGARHIRRRIWILAHSNEQGISEHVGERRAIGQWTQKEDIWGDYRLEDIILHSDLAPSEWQKEGQKSDPRPLLVRGDDGISDELDRIAALGNAIVPQVAMSIMSAMKHIDAISQNDP